MGDARSERLNEQLPAFAELHMKVAAGLASLDRGEGLDGEAAFEELDTALGPEKPRQ